MTTTKLSWPERFALIEHYSPDDSTICKVFNLTSDELEVAKNLKANGTFATSKTFDPIKYGNPFVSSTEQVKQKPMTTHTKPETATKKTKVPQKRGRKGDKIQNAFLAVPSVPVPVDMFTKQHQISVAVLRQSKRFLEKMDPTIQQQIGKINVKQDKSSKNLMVWKEQD